MWSIFYRAKMHFCEHRFALEDLKMQNRDSAGTDRVSWSCDKCGCIFTAHCGLDISPKHGPTFRRETKLKGSP